MLWSSFVRLCALCIAGNSFFNVAGLSQGSSLGSRGKKRQAGQRKAAKGFSKRKRVIFPNMPMIAHLFAPIALLLPAVMPDVPRSAVAVRAENIEAQWSTASVPAGPPLMDNIMESGNFSSFIVNGLNDDSWNQVRIEQRMIIRIAPRLPGQFVALPTQPQLPPRFFERKTSKCLPIASIAGVQPESSSRLLLITRGRKLIGASLDKSCRARDFYSGFYVEQNQDGQLCAGRDMIHSRAGANCAVTKLRELVPEDD
jgi:hypothetical protein